VISRVVLALLVLVGLAVVGVQTVDRRASSVEAAVRRYAAAVSVSDLDAAMAEIAPAQRDRWHDWVAGQLGNVYEVRGIAVRARSVFGAPYEVTVAMDVNRDFPGEFYQPTPRVQVVEEFGNEYLGVPLLANQ
jgi:hypothetical protein